MAYADYGFYKNVYRGTLSEDDFSRLSERASDYIDGRTEYILKWADIPEELSERVKKACCALADTIRDNDLDYCYRYSRYACYYPCSDVY